MRYRGGKASLFDLKYYGSQFLKVKDDNFPLITNIPQSDETKKEKHKVPRSLDISFNAPYNLPADKSIQKLEEQIALKMGSSSKHISKQLSKIERLRNKIQVIKRLNDQKHRDILNLYNKNSNDLVADIKMNKKPVKRIKLFDPEVQKARVKLKQEGHKNQQFIDEFYSSIGKENDVQVVDYKKRLSEIQMTLKNSQIPRKVEEFLVSKNMRIPKFLKQLKS